MEKYKEVVRNRDRVCQICGTVGSKDNPLTVHHIVYKCRGGSNSPENLVLLCQRCHRNLHSQGRYQKHRAISRNVKKRRRKNRH